MSGRGRIYVNGTPTPSTAPTTALISIARSRRRWHRRGLTAPTSMAMAGPVNALLPCSPTSISPALRWRKPMPIEQFYLVGAGGHGLVVLDALQSSGMQAEICVVDESPDRIGRSALGLTVRRFDAAT